MQTNSWTLAQLPLAWKALFSGYLMVAGLGLLMSLGQIYATHGMADGKAGLSVDDIVYGYYGHRENSVLESKLRGSMHAMASGEERQVLIDWVRQGAPESEWQPTIEPIMQARCVACHASMPNLSSLSSYESVRQTAKIDLGADATFLTRTSHVHLFGISLVFVLIGGIFALAQGVSAWLKAGLIFVPFVFLILDVAGWWLTAWQPAFAYLILIGGGGYFSSAGVMILLSLYQLWFLKVIPVNSTK